MASTQHDTVIRITNRLATYASIGLFYWVVIFLTATVFDLKIFRERMTEMFSLSLLGIFAILGGTVILNVMSNLSKISQSLAAAEPTPAPALPAWKKIKVFLLLLALPVIIAALFIGDAFSAQKRQQRFVYAAERFIQENQSQLIALSQYQFSAEYVKNTEKVLGVLNKIDKNFPEVMIIFPDTVEGKSLFLGFGGRSYRQEDKALEKTNYIYSASVDEREYLQKVFAGTETAYRFYGEKSRYQFYFPTTIGGNKLVIYLSDFQRYGKFGS